MHETVFVGGMMSAKNVQGSDPDYAVKSVKSRDNHNKLFEIKKIVFFKESNYVILS